jgi:predicted RecB family nuclease
MSVKTSVRLSKSKYIAGMQCEKRLYLSTFPPEDAKDIRTAESMPILNGYAFGDLACEVFPGVMVEFDYGKGQAAATTSKLIADPNVKRIHEATFEFEGVYVRVDLLERTAKGWNLVEVKASTSVKKYYIHDMTIQTWVLQGCGVQVDNVYLMYVNNQFVYQGDGEYEGLFKRYDATAEVMAGVAEAGNRKAGFVTMLSGEMPDIAMSEHCHSPYDCEFVDYCRGKEPAPFPLSVLPNLREAQMQKLVAAGYEDIRDIPEGVLTNANHQRVWRATNTGKVEVDINQLGELEALPYPRYYIDFETIGLSVPRWKGVRPYVQTPFQWSCHIQYEDGRLEHTEFLDISGNDPRRACAEGLVKYIGKEGVLIAYNAGFEKGVIAKLAESFPDLAEALLEMNTRFYDLLPLARKAYYHPEQKGSWSIKKLLPALVPKLSYKDLAGVQDGGDAQIAWLQAAKLNQEEQEELKSQLLAYCKLDTLAMVKIIDALLVLKERGLHSEHI